MNNSYDHYEIELCHYGILGMHWGIRRTPEQLGHKKNKTRFRTGKMSDEEKAKFKQQLIRSGDRNLVEKYQTMLTDDEFRQALNRVDLSDSLSSKKIAAAAERGKAIEDKLRRIGNMAESGKKIYNVVADLNNAINPDKRLPKLGDKPDKGPSEKDKAELRKTVAEADKAEYEAAMKKVKAKETISKYKKDVANDNAAETEARFDEQRAENDKIRNVVRAMSEPVKSADWSYNNHVTMSNKAQEAQSTASMLTQYSRIAAKYNHPDAEKLRDMTDKASTYSSAVSAIYSQYALADPRQGPKTVLEASQLSVGKKYRDMLSAINDSTIPADRRRALQEERDATLFNIASKAVKSENEVTSFDLGKYSDLPKLDLEIQRNTVNGKTNYDSLSDAAKALYSMRAKK